MLDFGMSFGLEKKYFANFVKPRKAVAMSDLFELGLLPRLEGIYRNDYLDHMGLPEEEPTLDAVFVSHAHGDHVDYLCFLHQNIPIYCSEETKAIIGSD